MENKSTRVMRLSELAEATGLTRQTIQYYLLLGLIEGTSRTKGGQRRFDKRIVKRVKLIHKLNRSGYTLREIREVFLKDRQL